MAKLSKSAKIDLETGEVVQAQDAPYVRPRWHRQRVEKRFEGESKTQQHHRDQTDINYIVERYSRTGEIPGGRREGGQYGDVTQLQGDLGERIIKSRQVVDKAEEAMAKKKKEDAERVKKELADREAAKAANVKKEVAETPTEPAKK